MTKLVAHKLLLITIVNVVHIVCINIQHTALNLYGKVINDHAGGPEVNFVWLYYDKLILPTTLEHFYVFSDNWLFHCVT